MTTSTLRLRSIGDLLGERFHVPRYQRGYRWTPLQVEALLDDLSSFQRRERGPEAYYCLQPVVVRRRPEGDWELVDGQQRLTTISLVLCALEEIARFLSIQRHVITYETRPGSAEFLLRPTAEDAGKYIDYHHMFEAYEAIRRWFAARDGALRVDLIRCLTGPDGTGPNVRVIWYELDPGEDLVKAFVRLNVGRIPLTSAELIRALLLRTDRAGLEERDAQQLAQDWDRTERSLQDEGYWYFLQSDRSAPPARIEYVFDLFVAAHGEGLAAGLPDDPLATFLAFQELLNAGKEQVWPLWQKFMRLTRTLEDWHEDRTLFHLVGFLVATAIPEKRADGARRPEAKVLLDLLKARRGLTATEFDRHVRGLIWRRLAGPKARVPSAADFTRQKMEESLDERLDELDYGKDLVRVWLLLFNVAGLLEQTASTQRFQFDGFKKNTWDIEHVRSVAEYIPRAAADRKRWLQHARDFVAGPAAAGRNPEEAKELVVKIDALLAAPSPEEESFTDVFTRVRALVGEPEARADDNAISNLVLLDMGTNRSYRNAIFPVKRERIIKLDRDGKFVPPATRNVFLKYYSPHAAQLMLWDAADQRAYGAEIRETLLRFFQPLLPAEGAT